MEQDLNQLSNEELMKIAGIGQQNSAAINIADESNRFNTQLNPREEKEFQGWAKSQKRDIGETVKQYDLRGYWKNRNEYPEDPSGRGHLPDTYKKPNYPTFSDESIYSGVDIGNGKKIYGGQWKNSGDKSKPSDWSFMASPDNVAIHGAEGIKKHFQAVDPESKFELPSQSQQKDLNSMSNEQLMQIAGIQPRSTTGEVARPFLKAAKSMVAGALGGAADLANLVVEAPIYAGYKATQAITGDKTPYKPIFAGTSVTDAIKKKFDEATGGLTEPRNKAEQLLEIPEEILGGAVLPEAVNKIGQAAKTLAPKNILQKAIGITPKSQETLKAFEDAGVNPRLSDIIQGQTSKTFQNLLGNFPGSRGVIEKATQEQVDNIAKQLAGVAKSEGGTIQETGKVIQRGAENIKTVLENRINKNYNDLDKFVLTESQRNTAPRLAEAIDEWSNLKNLERGLTGDIQGNAKMASLINEDASQKLGFWKNRARNEAAKSINLSAEDARSLANVKKQISNQEKVISRFEKYMSPEQFESALISGQAKIPAKNLTRLADDPSIQDVAAVGSGDTAKVISRFSNLLDQEGQISYPRLKTFRSTVGAKLSSPSLQGDERGALKKIYGALSEDMKDAIALHGGTKGLQAFDKANNAFVRYQNILESKINPIIEAKTPEAVYSMAMSGTKQGGSNIRGIMKTLDPAQKEYVVGTITKRMGLESAGGQDATGEVFNPGKFLTEWNKLSPEARSNIYDKSQVQAIANLNKVIASIKESGKARQGSNNLPYAAWLGLLGYGAGVAGIPKAAAGVGLAHITARMITNPKFLNWLAKAPSTKVSEIPKHLKALSAIAASNPDIQEDVLDYLESITQEKSQEQNGS